MSEVISVNTKELKKCSRRINSHLANFHKQLLELYNNNINKLNQGWKSSENQAFISNITDCIMDFKELGLEIASYEEFLNNAAEKYEDNLLDALRIATSFDRE